MNGWALRAVLRRGRSQSAILAVVLLVSLLATTLVASLAVLAEATERFAVPAALNRAEPIDRRIDLDLDTAGRDLAPIHEAVSAAVEEALGEVPSTREVQHASPLHTIERTGADILVYLAAYDRFAEHARLVAGKWPAEAGGGEAAEGENTGATLRVAVPQQLATARRLRVGSALRLRDEAVQPLTVRVVGIYRISRTGGDFFSSDPLQGAGHDPGYSVPYTGGRIRTDAYGPLITTAERFESGAVSTDRLSIRSTADFAGLAPAEIAPLRERIAEVEDRLPIVLGSLSGGVRASTRLPDTLERVQRFLFVTRSGVILTALQLLVLAVAALLLATRLLAERRLTEQALMRARGASGRQLVRLASVEALLLAAITTGAAPPLARWLYLTLVDRPEFTAAGLNRDPGMPLIAWLAAGGASLLFVLVLVTPLLRRSGTFVEQEQAASRQDRRTVLQRSGLDLGLLVLAGLAYWQLRAYRSPLIESGGSLRIDPVLVAGPALCLLAGALLGVRLVPLLARWLERAASRGSSIVAPLAAWEVGRRSKRAIGAVLLLTLALAVGTFGLSYLDTWRASQRDQADFQVGTDLRLTQPAHPPLAQAAALRRIPGADAVTPVTAQPVEIGSVDDGSFFINPEEGGGPTAQLLAVDSQRFAGFLRGRELTGDGASATLADQLGPLAPLTAPRPVVLPAGAERISLQVRAEPPTTTDGSRMPMSIGVSLELIGDRGARQSLPVGELPADGRAHRLTATLPAAAAGEVATAAGGEGLRLAAIQTRWGVSGFVEGGPGTGDVLSKIRIDGVRTVDTEGTASPVAAGKAAWHGLTSTSSEQVEPVQGALIDESVRFFGGELAFVQAVTAVFTTWEPGGSVPVIATDQLLAEQVAAVGDQLAVRVGDTAIPVTITASVPNLPSAPPGRAGLLADRDALNRRLIEVGGTGAPVDEWWISVPAQRAADYAAAVREAELGEGLSRVLLARQMQEEPLRIGIQAALWLLIAAAAAFAGLGFAMHTTVAIRLRRTEFTQLRALGIGRRSLTAVVALENLMLAAIGIGCGVGLGALLGWLVGPLVSVAADGSQPMPPVQVHIPWADVGLLALEICALLALVVLGVTRALRRSVLGAVLRLGDER